MNWILIVIEVAVCVLIAAANALENPDAKKEEDDDKRT